MPHKSKNSVEEKVHMVQRCLKGEIDIEEASRENRINRAAIQGHGSAYASCYRARRELSPPSYRTCPVHI